LRINAARRSGNPIGRADKPQRREERREEKQGRIARERKRTRKRKRMRMNLLAACDGVRRLPRRVLKPQLRAEEENRGLSGIRGEK
jgi:hypothetical protein